MQCAGASAPHAMTASREYTVSGITGSREYTASGMTASREYTVHLTANRAAELRHAAQCISTGAIGWVYSRATAGPLQQLSEFMVKHWGLPEPKFIIDVRRSSVAN